MNDMPLPTLLVFLLGAAMWNFGIASITPQRIPRTSRGCALWGGIEGTVIGGIVLIVQGLTDHPGELMLIFNGLRFGFAWSVFSIVAKNHYRRLEMITYRDTLRTDEDEHREF